MTRPMLQRKIFPLNMAHRLDPTRTTTLRHRFVADMTRRFKALQREITEAVVKQDVFGLKQDVLVFAERKQFAFTRSADKVDGFMKWLAEMEQKHIFTIHHKPGRLGDAINRNWSDVYIESAYKTGIRRAGEELKKGGVRVPIPAGELGVDRVVLSFNQPVHADRVGLLYTRAFNELKGVTNAMDQQISRILAQGIADGKNPMELAKEINNRVDKIGLTRAKMIARTEIVRAHHMASIQEYKNAGLLGVMIQSEWLTAGFDVCEECYEMSKRDMGHGPGIYTIEEIEPLIPFHPNCRCTAIPYLEGISEKPVRELDLDLDLDDVIERAPELAHGKYGEYKGMTLDSADKIREALIDAEHELINDPGYAKLIAERDRLEKLRVYLEKEADAVWSVRSLDPKRSDRIFDNIFDRISKIDDVRFKIHHQISTYSRDYYQQILKAGKPAFDPPVYFTGANVDMRRDVEKAKQWVREVVGLDGIAFHEFRVEVDGTRTRAAYDPSVNTIRLGPRDGVNAVVHELGHHLDNSSWSYEQLYGRIPDSSIARSTDFLASRSTSKDHIFMGTQVYADGRYFDEVAIRGNFLNRYTGKLYPEFNSTVGLTFEGRNIRQATEIISMGLEQLYRDPLKFAQEDPSHFNFTLSVIKRIPQ